MAVAGSITMWLGVPVGLIYLVSKLVDTQQPTMGPYLDHPGSACRSA